MVEGKRCPAMGRRFSRRRCSQHLSINSARGTYVCSRTSEKNTSRSTPIWRSRRERDSGDRNSCVVEPGPSGWQLEPLDTSTLFSCADSSLPTKRVERRNEERTSVD
eukprot:scaffold1233_cov395-Prasinococcus_capsulatus_cf.AAC.7